MKQYTFEKISPHVWRMKDILQVAMYLVTGNRYACLIDTGYGLTGLKEAVNSITDLPVFVLLTHGHVDHAFGIYEFETVYMNERDLETYQMHADPVYRERFIRAVTEDYDVLQFQQPHEVRFQNVVDEQTFDLGGIHVKAHHVPGHTRGMMVYIIQEERIALFGDACGPNTMLMEDCSSSLQDYLAALHNLKQYENTYDRIVRNHGTCESPKILLDNVIRVSEQILAGTDDKKLLPTEMQTMFPTHSPVLLPCYSARAVLPEDSFQEGNINYREDKVKG